MLIPQFSLSQDNLCIIISIRVPYVKISKSEFYIEGNTFKFYLHPYALDITLKQSLKLQEEPSNLQYDHNTYVLTVSLLKQTPGEHFDDLQLISALLSKKRGKGKGKGKGNALIEVIGGNDEGRGCLDGIGLGGQYHMFFKDLCEENQELCQLNPDNTSVEDRQILRDKIVKQDFDGEDYVYDALLNEELEEMIGHPEEIDYLWKGEEKFSSLETDILIRLGGQLALNQQQQDKSALILVDVLFSLLYELWSMQGDYSVESAKTINNLSSILSTFSVDETVEQVIQHNIQRSLTYSLYRNCKISEQVMKWMKEIFNQKERCKYIVVKHLLGLKQLFDNHEPRYLLNKIYIDDLIGFVQTLLSSEQISQIHQAFQSIQLNKKTFNIIGDLSLIEYAYLQEEGQDLMEQMNQINLGGEGDEKEEEVEEVKEVEERKEYNIQKEKKVLIQEIQEEK